MINLTKIVNTALYVIFVVVLVPLAIVGALLGALLLAVPWALGMSFAVTHNKKVTGYFRWFTYTRIKNETIN